MRSIQVLVSLALLFPLWGQCLACSATEEDGASPGVEERQLPLEMHSEMEERPKITVGRADADFVGSDQRVLQAAVDFVANLGGGTVEIGAGEFMMRDSLHLRSNVTVRGIPGKTVLRKSPAVVSDLALDGDFGEQQFTIKDLDGFEVGAGVAIWDNKAHGFHTTVARITGRRGKTFSIDKPLMADCMVARGAKAGTIFPVVSGYDLVGVRIEGLTIEGSRDSNVHLNGCRGAGIFLYRAFGTVIRNCTIRSYNGDGVSFQQSNDVTVENCLSEQNASLGFHPGSGSQRPAVRGSIARGNGTDGLYLCWRVRHGVFEDNLLEGNRRFGISIGHKDSDNLIRKNRIRLNGQNGVFFRNETLNMAAHRNRIEENVIEDNGTNGDSPTGNAAIRIRGETRGLVFKGNVIRDTRSAGNQTQKTGILIENRVGEVVLEGNQIEADVPIDDRRVSKESE